MPEEAQTPQDLEYKRQSRNSYNSLNELFLEPRNYSHVVSRRLIHTSLHRDVFLSTSNASSLPVASVHAGQLDL